jgi:hypothetical protein
MATQPTKINKAAKAGSFLLKYYKPITYIGIGVTVSYFLARALQKFTVESKRLQDEKKAVETELSKAVKEKPLSYPESQYQSFARVIQIAGFDLGTDEAAIYNVFRSLKNNADYLALSQAWGKPTRKVYEWGIGRDMTLQQFIRWEMDQKEVAKINLILKNRNIKYRI